MWIAVLSAVPIIITVYIVFRVFVPFEKGGGSFYETFGYNSNANSEETEDANANLIIKSGEDKPTNLNQAPAEENINNNMDSSDELQNTLLPLSEEKEESGGATQNQSSEE